MKKWFRPLKPTRCNAWALASLLFLSCAAARAQDPHLYVPYVPTPPPVVDAMLKLAQVKAGEVVYDLGCGDGRIVIAAVKQFGAKRGIGIDIDKARIREANENAEAARVTDKVEFKLGDVLKLESVADANVVALYMTPNVNRKLEPMLRKTLKPGARVVAHDFKVGDWPPERTERVKDGRGKEHVLYLWTIK